MHSLAEVENSEEKVVSQSWPTSPSQPASVVVGGTTSLVFDYDRASTLDITMVGKDTGGAPPAAVSVAIRNTHLLPSGSRVVAGSGPTRVVAGLFPFADGYTVRVGKCADASSGDPAAAVEPGSTAVVTVGLPEVLVTLQHDDGLGHLTPVAGAIVTASHAADASCTTGESYALGTTDAFGQLLVALPYGTWSVSVNGIPYPAVLPAGGTPGDADGAWPFDLAVTQ